MPKIPPVLYQSPGFTFTQSTATMVLFALLMLLVAIAMIRNDDDTAQPLATGAAKTNDIVKLILIGILIGLVTGLLCAGGGFLVIPALVLILKIPMKEAVGTSLLIVALNSLIGFTGDLGHVAIDWRFLISITLIAVAGIFVGGFLANKIDGEKLKKAFGCFVLLMGVFFW